jgi:hypothetical protein
MTLGSERLALGGDVAACDIAGPLNPHISRAMHKLPIATRDENLMTVPLYARQAILLAFS